MSEWIVYSKDGLKERCRLKSVEYNGSYMNERVVTATFKHFEEVAFEVFDYIEYRGERFEIEAIPTVKKTSSHDYEYDLRFVSLKYELERCEMRDIVPDDNRVVYPTPLTFSFTGTVRYLAERIQANLDALYGEGVWSITLEGGVDSEEKNITISQQNCWNALSLVNTTYNLNFQVRGRNVVIGNSNSSVGYTFKYGKGNGLYEIERTSDSDTGIVTKLRAYGSDRNLDYSYPKKPEWSDSVLDTSFILSPLRLMLPSFKTDGKTDYILADEAVIAKYGIREASVIYDDIYPSITGAVVAGNAIDEIKGVEPITDDNAPTFVIYLHNLGFDLESHLTTSDAQISMKSGAMQGYTFNMSNIEKQSDGSYKITLGRITTDTSDTGNYSIPNNDWNMKAGDKFVLLNILMPQEYIRNAEERLLERAEEYLAEYGKTNFGYSVGIHDKFLKEHSDIYDQLVEGSKLSVYDEEIGINEEVTIQSLTITENAESNILPQVKVTLNNKPSASTLERIQGQIKELSDSASGSFSSQSELLSQYRKKLDKPFFDRLFAAVDEKGNEIPSTDLTTPIFYIKARYNFASLGGITTYLNDGSFDLPSIYAGIPFDNRTIWLNPETKLVEVIGGTGGGSGEGGVSNFWDLTNIPTWITATKPEYSYGEIKGTPDLSEYAKTSDIPSLDGYATTEYVTQTFATKLALEATNDALTTKWTKDDAKITNWDTAYGWGNHADAGYFLASKFTKSNIKSKLGISDWALAATKPSYTTKEVTEDTNLYFTNQRAINALTDTLKAYVTIKDTQTIEGEKNFTGGLKVNGSLIYYDSANGYWKLEGDLLVTGGVTQYASESAFNPSTIMDAVNVDGQTIIKQNGILMINPELVLGGGGEGEVTSVAWGNIIGKPSWITDTVPYITIGGKKVSLNGTITSNMIVDTLGYTPYDSSNPNGYITTDALSYYQPLITESAKLSTSLISGLHAVATSGSYNDLSNKPDIPTNTNQLTNGAGFITASDNVASATKLANKRKIWGQEFNGESDVDGLFTLTSNSGRPFKINWMADNSTIQLWSYTSSEGFADMCLGSSKDTPSKALYFNGTDGYWGVGTIAPQYKFDISGSLRATGNVYLCKDSSYRVGIRTETPEQALDVNGGFQVSGLSHLKGTVYKYNTDKSYRLTFAYNISSDANTAHIYNISNDGSVMGDLRIGNTAGHALVVAANNRVGIGKPVPEYKLDVNGSVGATQYYVNGIKVSKTQDGVLCIDGNLVVTGGITAYYNNGTLDLPNLYDGLPIDGTTIYWAESANGKVLKAKVADGGILEITDTMIVEALGYVPYSSNNPNGYITSSALNGYATQSWVNQQGFLTEHQDLSGYQTKITSTNKLAYSLISGTPDLSGYLKKGENAASATKLATSRKIWGQSFDGQKDVKGNLYICSDTATTVNEASGKIKFNSINANDYYRSPYIQALYYGTYARKRLGFFQSNELQYDNADGFFEALSILPDGNIGVNQPSPEYKLHVNGTGYFQDSVVFGSTITGNHWGINDNENNPQIRLTRDFKNWYVQVSGESLALGTSFNPCRIDEGGNFDTPSSVTINGIKLYKSNDGVLFLDGNLVVRGGITQYADDGTTAPSIFDSLPVASTSVKGIAQFSSTYFSVSNGIVTIKEGSVGLNEDELNGILEGKGYLTSDDLIWSNIKSKPTTIAGYGITDAVTLTGTQYISGAKYFQRDAANGLYIENTGETNTSKYIAIRFRHSGANVSGIASSNTTDSYLYRINAAYNATYKIWDEGNFNPSNYLLASSYTAADVLAKLKTVDGSDTGLDADLLDGKHLSDILASNVASATKLQTARKIWGRSFDGTADINGRLTYTTNTLSRSAFNHSGDQLVISDCLAETFLRGTAVKFQNSVGTNAMILTGGNLGIGTTSPEYKLDVTGTTHITGAVTLGSTLTGNYWYLNNSSTNPYLRLTRSSVNWYVQLVAGGLALGQGSANSCTIDASGNFLSVGGITQYSQRSLKNIVDERGLSLEELSVIKPTRYTWKDKRDESIHIGGIADDVMKVLPEVVIKTNDNILTMDYGNAGFAIAASLIKPVVDHEERIRRLERENRELKEQVKRLSA